MGIGRLLLRVVIGGIFVAHGMQKLTGAFGGGGIEGTAKMMEQQRMYPPKRNATAAGFAEAAGGAMIVLGAGMPLATAMTTAAMATAVKKVHLDNGFFNAQGGYEFNLALTASATALTIDGPGPLSIDALLGKHRWGVFWGLLGAGLGWVASSFAIERGEDLARQAGATAPESSTATPEDAGTGASPGSR